MINGTPLVSIVIPCYKAEKHLPTALSSISNQTHTNWEVLAINDCWEDSTEKIVLDFRQSHPRQIVKYIKHDENKGLGATRNTGMEAATGDFIAFLDHDDLWEPNHLTTALNVLTKKKADIYYSAVSVFNADGTGDRWIWGPTLEDLEQFPQSIFKRNFIQPSAVVLTRIFMTKLGSMDTNPNIHFCEDHDYWIRAVNLNAKFVTTNDITASYRYANPDAATSKIPLMIEHDISVQKKHLETNKFDNSIKHQAISANYRRLSDFFWRSNHFKSLWYLLQSVYWHPNNLANLKQLMKGLVYWPLLRLKLKGT